MFEVVKEHRPKFQDCKYIGYSIEPLYSKLYQNITSLNDLPSYCIAVAPHTHSVYCPQQLSLPPWELRTDRNVLLGYYGSNKSGRNNTIRHFLRAQSIQTQYPGKFTVKSNANASLFRAHEIMSPQNLRFHPDLLEHMVSSKKDSLMYVELWELYAQVDLYIPSSLFLSLHIHLLFFITFTVLFFIYIIFFCRLLLFLHFLITYKTETIFNCPS